LPGGERGERLDIESFAESPDIAAIWKSQSLDLAYIDRWAPTLGTGDAWQALRQRLEACEK
jgi:hypothetical protein